MKMVADQTDGGYATAEKRFNEFALENKYPKLDDLTKIQMLGEFKNATNSKLILSGFCSYVLNYKKDDSGTHVGPAMQWQYLRHESIECCDVLVMLYHAVGHGGEVLT
jgi:hypothetical protein